MSHYIAFTHGGEDGWCDLTPPTKSRRKLGRILYRGQSNRVHLFCQTVAKTYGQPIPPYEPVAKRKRRRYGLRIATISDASAKRQLREARQEYEQELRS